MSKVFKFPSRDDVIDNAVALLEGVRAQPTDKFNLESMMTIHPACGTLFCVAGLAHTLSHFQERGLQYRYTTNQMTADRYTRYPSVDQWGENEDGEVIIHGPLETVEVMLGERLNMEPLPRLFMVYGNGDWDDELIEQLGLPTRQQIKRIEDYQDPQQIPFVVAEIQGHHKKLAEARLEKFIEMAVG